MEIVSRASEPEKRCIEITGLRLQNMITYGFEIDIWPLVNFKAGNNWRVHKSHDDDNMHTG